MKKYTKFITTRSTFFDFQLKVTKNCHTGLFTVCQKTCWRVCIGEVSTNSVRKPGISIAVTKWKMQRAWISDGTISALHPLKWSCYGHDWQIHTLKQAKGYYLSLFQWREKKKINKTKEGTLQKKCIADSLCTTIEGDGAVLKNSFSWKNHSHWQHTAVIWVH